jgi:hypothetical protein
MTDLSHAIAQMDKHEAAHHANPVAPCQSDLCEDRGRELAEGTATTEIEPLEWSSNE